MVLYTIHCPKCKVLETKLKQKNISYEEETDIEKMKELGIMTSPVLFVNGKYLQFSDAVKFINQYDGGNIDNTN